MIQNTLKRHEWGSECENESTEGEKHKLFPQIQIFIFNLNEVLLFILYFVFILYYLTTKKTHDKKWKKIGNLWHKYGIKIYLNENKQYLHLQHPVHNNVVHITNKQTNRQKAVEIFSKKAFEQTKLNKNSTKLLNFKSTIQVHNGALEIIDKIIILLSKLLSFKAYFNENQFVSTLLMISIIS